MLIQQAQKTVQLPQPQFIDEVVDDSVLIRRQVPQSKLYRENQISRGDSASVQRQSGGSQPREDRDSTRSVLGKMVDGPVVQFHRSMSWEETVETPQPQTVQQHVVDPEIQTIELWQHARRPRSIPRVRSPVV